METDHTVKVSIITVSYNAADTIEQAILSVLNQSYDNIEYIIIDGQSADGTQEIIEKYRDRLAYYVSEPDGGIYDAMNKGIRQATGDVIAFLGSDDQYLPDALEYVARQFANKDIDLLWTRVFIDKNGKRQKSRRIDLERMPYGIAGCHQGAYAARKLFELLGIFDVQYRVMADYEWLLRVVKSGGRVKCSDDATVIYNGNGFSTLDSEYNRKEGRKISLKHAETDEIRKKVIEYYQLMDAVCLMRKRLENGEMVQMAQSDILRLQGGRIVVFGLGLIGTECAQILRMNDISISCYADNNEKMWGTVFCDRPVIAPKQIDLKNDMIVVATTTYECEISEQLADMGVPEVHMVLYSDIRKRICNAMPGSVAGE